MNKLDKIVQYTYPESCKYHWEIKEYINKWREISFLQIVKQY